MMSSVQRFLAYLLGTDVDTYHRTYTLIRTVDAEHRPSVRLSGVINRSRDVRVWSDDEGAWIPVTRTSRLPDPPFAHYNTRTGRLSWSPGLTGTLRICLEDDQ